MKPASASRTPQTRIIAALVAMTLALQGCAVDWAREHRLYCRISEPAEKTLIRDTLYFGSSIPGGGDVGSNEWADFESTVLAREFPQGFTVFDSHGAWRGENGDTVRERGHVVVLVHANNAAAESAVRRIIERYRATFHQEAVLRERTIACVTL